MKERFYSQATSRAAYKDLFCVSGKAVAKTVCVCLAFFCLMHVFGGGASGQSETISVAVFEFKDEGGAEPPSGVAHEIARKLAQKLNAAYNDVLARQLDAAPDASSIKAMNVDQLVALGKQHGVKFIVRGGLLAASDEKSRGETTAAIQLYADIVSVETLSIRSVRAAGNSAKKGQALSNAIEQLAESIHQAIVSSMSEPTASDEPTQDTGGEANRPDDSKDVDTAEADEELQQLIAQAESLVTDGGMGNTERLASLSQSLAALKAALESKATLLEDGKDPAPADQQIAQQKEKLQGSLSSLAESEMPDAPDAPDTQDQQPSGEKKNMLARIGEYAGETLNIIQKIQEIRAALRGANANSEQTETSGPDPTVEAPLSTEESTEEISGVVTEMGEPVAGVTVTEPESGVKAETDSNGSYALPGIPAGRLAKLVLAKGGKQMATGQIDLARGRSSIADFELKPQTAGASQPALRILPSIVRLVRAKTGDGNVGMLKGVVKDAQGRPAARALVLLGRAIARTDSQGQYAFLNVRPGAHQIIVHRSGSRPRTEMVQVAARKSSESKIQFVAADKIPRVSNRQSLLVRGTGNVLRGVVVDPMKRPLAGAKVTVVQQTSAVSVLAGPRGEYLLRDLRPGSYRVLVSKAGYVPTAQAVTVRAGEVQPRDFQLRKTDSPFIEKALAARRSNQNLNTGDAGKLDSPVNREGQQRNKIINSNQPSLVQIRIASLKGKVSDSKTGKPVSGATVSIQGRPRAKTDLEGNYSVFEVPVGNYRISVSRAGFSEQERSVNVLADKSRHENFALVAENANGMRGTARRPQLPTGVAEIRTGQLRGRIVDAKTGKPVSGVLVSVAGQRTVTSDRDGSYAFKDLAPGPYRVIARKNEFLDGIASLVIRPGETTTANMRLNAKPFNRVRYSSIRPAVFNRFPWQPLHAKRAPLQLMK
jgi:protocatechuate 3,4-dioxygenase beta subunit